MKNCTKSAIICTFIHKPFRKRSEASRPKQKISLLFLLNFRWTSKVFPNTSYKTKPPGQQQAPGGPGSETPSVEKAIHIFRFDAGMHSQGNCFGNNLGSMIHLLVHFFRSYHQTAAERLQNLINYLLFLLL